MRALRRPPELSVDRLDSGVHVAACTRAPIHEKELRVTVPRAGIWRRQNGFHPTRLEKHHQTRMGDFVGKVCTYVNMYVHELRSITEHSVRPSGILIV
jgi:hypothetical protein